MENHINFVKHLTLVIDRGLLGTGRVSVSINDDICIT